MLRASSPSPRSPLKSAELSPRTLVTAGLWRLSGALAVSRAFHDWHLESVRCRRSRERISLSPEPVWCPWAVFPADGVWALRALLVWSLRCWRLGSVESRRIWAWPEPAREVAGRVLYHWHLATIRGRTEACSPVKPANLGFQQKLKFFSEAEEVQRLRGELGDRPLAVTEKPHRRPGLEAERNNSPPPCADGVPTATIASKSPQHSLDDALAEFNLATGCGENSRNGLETAMATLRQEFDEELGAAREDLARRAHSAGCAEAALAHERDEFRSAEEEAVAESTLLRAELRATRHQRSVQELSSRAEEARFAASLCSLEADNARLAAAIARGGCHRGGSSASNAEKPATAKVVPSESLLGPEFGLSDYGRAENPARTSKISQYMEPESDIDKLLASFEQASSTASSRKRHGTPVFREGERSNEIAERESFAELTEILLDGAAGHAIASSPETKRRHAANAARQDPVQSPAPPTSQRWDTPVKRPPGIPSQPSSMTTRPPARQATTPVRSGGQSSKASSPGISAAGPSRHSPSRGGRASVSPRGSQTARGSPSGSHSGRGQTSKPPEACRISEQARRMCSTVRRASATTASQSSRPAVHSVAAAGTPPRVLSHQDQFLDQHHGDGVGGSSTRGTLGSQQAFSPESRRVQASPVTYPASPARPALSPAPLPSRRLNIADGGSSSQSGSSSSGACSSGGPQLRDGGGRTQQHQSLQNQQSLQSRHASFCE